MGALAPLFARQFMFYDILANNNNVNLIRSIYEFKLGVRII